ncbi:MAG TPA: hypothetical protein VFP84_19455, partial [Kofleriaceae bacterium]|nr:hypothetical protein [Kofleriaceae bacterium]
MATKSGQPEPEKAEVVEELLDALDAALDRVKVLYEQYFLGIQKQPPTFLHTDIERKIRDIMQLQVRNTALRYRFATLQQKFGSYNSYWRRTLRQIENGTYARNLSKVGRQAARTGAAVPEEILAAMPKRMRDQVVRDREQALALAKLRHQEPADGQGDDELLTLADEEVDLSDLSGVDLLGHARDARDERTADGALRVDEADADFDLDAFFAKVINEDAPEPTPAGGDETRRTPASNGHAARHPRPTGVRAPAAFAGPLPSTTTHAAATQPVARMVEPHHLPTQPLRPSETVTAASPPIAPTAFTAVTQPVPTAAFAAHPMARPTAMQPVIAPVIAAVVEADDHDNEVRIYAPPVPRQASAMPIAPPAGAIPRVPRVIPPVIPPTGPVARTKVPPSEVTPANGVPTAVMPPLPTPRPPAPPPRGSTLASSQATRPNPIKPGASSGLSAPVETLAGP